MKVFISYSSNDKDLAASFKQSLEDYGLDVFLAHEDIKPTEEWIEVILAELKACDVFLPLLTDNYCKSDWTDQECGIAFALDKLIIALKHTKDPHGFIYRFQALKINNTNLGKTCYNIVELIASKPVVGTQFRDCLIERFSRSYSYDDATRIAEIIININGFSKKQIREIIRCVINNDQINHSYSARRQMRKFVNRYSEMLEREMIDAFDNSIS